MKWASAIYSNENEKDRVSDSGDGLEAAIQHCASQIKEQLDGLSVDLVSLFISPHFKSGYKEVPDLVRQSLEPGCFIGCSAGGLIGGGMEVEHRPCVAMTAANLPGASVKSFYASDEQLPDLDDPQDRWFELVGGIDASERPSFVVLPEPFGFRIDVFVKGMDFAYPTSVKVGGLASGGMRPGDNALFMNEEVYESGLVGVAMTGNVVVDAVVAQGCKPVGKQFNITRAEKNMLYELDGEPAVFALKKVIDGLSEQERNLIQDAVFLGLVMDEMKTEHKQGDFLIRNILGIEPTSGAIAVGELLANNRTVQFHVRDAASSADDLRFMLKNYRDTTLDGGDKPACGALMFSCLGRGAYLYGIENHDSECFKTYMGAVPLGGFFCNGEIGPVGNTTFLHGYTSSFGIFREKAEVL